MVSSNGTQEEIEDGEAGTPPGDSINDKDSTVKIFINHVYEFINQS